MALTLALSFASRTVFLWVFGVEYLGLNGLFSDVLAFLSLTDLGLNTAMVYSFYAPLAREDHRKLAALVQYYQRLYQTIALIVFLLGLLLLPVLPYLVHTAQPISHLSIYYLIALANVSLSYLFVFRTSILSADQRNYEIVRISMVVSVVQTVVQIASMLIVRSYILYLLIGSIGALATNLLSSRRAVRSYPYILTPAQLTTEEKADVRHTIFSGVFYKVSSVLLNATDNLLISVLVSTAAVGIYSNYLMIQNQIVMLATLVFSSLTAGIGNLIVQASPEKRQEVFACEQTVSFFSSLVLLPCYLLLVGDFIHLWIGEAYELDRFTVYAIGVNLYLATALQPLWSFRDATGLYRRTKYVMLACATLNLVLSIALGLHWGVFGILLASGLARLGTYFWYEPKLLFAEYFGTGTKQYYLGMGKNAMLVTACTCGLDALLTSVEIDTWRLWFVKAIGLTCFMAAVAFLVYHREPGFQIVLGKLGGLSIGSKSLAERIAIMKEFAKRPRGGDTNPLLHPERSFIFENFSLRMLCCLRI